jgi:hypothetical protein
MRVADYLKRVEALNTINSIAEGSNLIEATVLKAPLHGVLILTVRGSRQMKDWVKSI